MGVMQARRDFRFALEALQYFRVTGTLPHDLDGQGPLEQGILRQVHRAHGP